MKNLSKHIFSMLALVSVMNTASADVMDDIINAIKTGNSKALAAYFDTNVDITIMDEEETYSKTQAEMVIKDFFSKHSARSFEVVHEGTSAGDTQQYAIGTLTCANGSYRVYINIKQSGSSYVISELSIGEE